MYNVGQSVKILYRIDDCSLIYSTRMILLITYIFHVFSPYFISLVSFPIWFCRSFLLLPCFLSCLFRHFLLCCILFSHFPFFLFFPFVFFTLGKIKDKKMRGKPSLTCNEITLCSFIPYLFPQCFCFYFPVLACFLTQSKKKLKLLNVFDH